MEELNWKRWVRVDDHLRIALETTLPAGVMPEYVDVVEVPSVAELEADKMIYRAKEAVEKKFNPLVIKTDADGGKETVDRHYHPSIGDFPNLRSAVRRVAFKVHIKKGDKPENGLFKRLCLHRHRGGHKFAANMLCGRAKELKQENQDRVFGFNSDRSSNVDYLSLSYPGEDGKFEPLFIKAMDPGMNAPYYLKIEAHDEADGVVVVEVSLVSILKVPAFLRV
ncbi:hypothetical protein A2926_01325 [Candidatus Giovannonibacteria bacterium RIFCSPLOWO2_01_FULL_44_40]|uniref:Uncharacterized protein n=1 Tax=Candidatus Giovannonibacteria bacterium RIFCSPHIGHO2_01_FULL_45_23 TaxID=1798325 RepID=A0A1F5VHL2_9BACT|nr:MAG: hypothetical protein A2834_00640 [Candidatus Giovannonibacteria bacterium RIFCSPHIGHO2_01_FULL_45_23]OGF75863.1 MAG: hypothetical protein A3C77_02090 [Candidatus Giovannonibacteria bacterium RIFCSPHIGHO2_02_FULL_45_13]OGF79641.1 MAG: hypothetical protein A2926_01325 [Candidatus Giovannonibacteria bacterium RIFCSPLOWO2_01_FULL_44_40]